MNPFGAEIFQANQVDTLAVDALVPSIARTSATTVLNMQDITALVFQKEGFNYNVPPES